MLETQKIPRPGVINNTELLGVVPTGILFNIEEDYVLKPNLLEHYDYEGVNKKMFKLLKQWYGVDYELTRFLIKDPMKEGKYLLDIYPSKIK